MVTSDAAIQAIVEAVLETGPGQSWQLLRLRRELCWLRRRMEEPSVAAGVEGGLRRAEAGLDLRRARVEVGLERSRRRRLGRARDLQTAAGLIGEEPGRGPPPTVGEEQCPDGEPCKLEGCQEARLTKEGSAEGSGGGWGPAVDRMQSAMLQHGKR
jgi:hypothetical protein